MRKATRLSRMLMALVRAARKSRAKKAVPKKRPPGSSANMAGRLMKAKPPPMPSPSSPWVIITTGTMARAAMTATRVSSAQIQPGAFGQVLRLGHVGAVGHHDAHAHGQGEKGLSQCAHQGVAAEPGGVDSKQEAQALPRAGAGD